MTDIMQRPGKFLIDYNLLRRQPGVVLEIMKHMIIVSAQASFMGRRIEYEAFSSLFGVTSEGGETPLYDIMINEYDGNTEILAKKVE